jgi:MFS family permease
VTLMATDAVWWHLLPRGLTGDVRRLLAGKGVRAFADGAVAIILPTYLLQLGYSPFEIGIVITSTLLGSALATLAVGFLAHHYSRRWLLWVACVLMAATGIGFALTHQYWPILVIAFLGTLNPSSGDVSLFLPIEQTMLAETTKSSQRTAVFARYSLAGTLMGAVGTLAASLPSVVERQFGLSSLTALQLAFWGYGAIGLFALLLYWPLSPSVEAMPADAPKTVLSKSRGIVLGLAALFSLDAFAGGFAVQSLLTLWLYEAYHLSTATAAAILFWAGICTAISVLLSVPLAERFGLINTMVFTHLPANAFLILVPFAPNLTIAISLLLARSALSQMDVPARTSYVMAVVTPAERPAAASLTAVPRSLATALSPVIAGYLLTISTFGWPLIICGGLKAIYDLLLLWRFRRVNPEHDRTT